MIQIKGFHVLKKIHEGHHALVFRAKRLRDNQPVIIKLMKKEFPTLSEITRFRLEYETTQKLHLEGVIKAYRLEKYAQRLYMVLEDCGGAPLSRWTGPQKENLRRLLNLSIRLAEIIGQIHNQHVIHKDIAPTNIIWNVHDNQLRIIDFGLATSLSREDHHIQWTNMLEGTLAYMAPEQTGRMNRPVDYRSDYYALGATLYELFTGSILFAAQDPMEWVHAHIAEAPVPPHEVNAAIPASLSAIIMKLLAKAAEDRYQSAFGLISDLTACDRELATGQVNRHFKVGANDISPVFQIPLKLYGRQNEVHVLLESFNAICHGGNGLVLVKGGAGIGKTALVKEIHKTVSAQKGFFITGKCEPLEQNIPYAPLIQAFQELIQRVLEENERDIADWRIKILKQIGENAQLIVDVIPSLAWIIGKQPAVPDLPATAARNRFQHVFLKFAAVFCTPLHPLVIFIDDLQWSDQSTLVLMEWLLRNANLSHLLIIGSLREEEVPSNYFVSDMMQKLDQNQSLFKTITLKPLVREHIEQWIMESLHCSRECATSLSDLCHTKTQGNPFFLSQFLNHLVFEEIIHFDADHGLWRWDIARIQKARIMDNVIELMVANIKRLSETGSQLLKLSACLGNYFDFKTLFSLAPVPQNIVADALWESLKQGLILPMDDAYRYLPHVEMDGFQNGDIPPEINPGFKFSHDRIQQAAYSLIPASEKKRIHLKIGRLLQEGDHSDDAPELFFNMVNHLNLGVNDITLSDERLALCAFNLKAGQKAKSSAAYDVARSFFMTALGLLPPTCWETHYDQAFAVHAELVEAAYLTADFDQMDHWTAVLLKQARKFEDYLKIFEINIYARTIQNDMEAALKLALMVLKRLGSLFPQRPTVFHLALSFIKVLPGLHQMTRNDFKRFPSMRDPLKAAAIRILISAGPAAFASNPKYMRLFMLEAVRLSLRHGMTPQAAIGFATLSIFYCGDWGNIDQGYRLCQLALKMSRRFNDKTIETRVSILFNFFIRHWKEPLADALDPLLADFYNALETGDIEYAIYALQAHCVYLFYLGVNLDQVRGTFERFDKIIYNLDQKQPLYKHRIVIQTVQNLRQDSADAPTRLKGEAYDEDSMPLIHLKGKDYMMMFVYYFKKTFLCYLFGQYKSATAFAVQGEKYVSADSGILTVPIFYFLQRWQEWRYTPI